MMGTMESPREAFGRGPGAEKPRMDLRVSTDNLAAYLRVRTSGPQQAVTAEEVVGFLKENGIVHGVCSDSIRDFCEHRKFFLELTCALGEAPEDEEDGRLEYRFKTGKNMIPAVRKDGTVDYKDLGLVQNVSKGEVLCRIVPPAPGRDGVDVYGRRVPFRKGRMPVFPSGRNTVVSKDGLELTAAVDGCIEYRDKGQILNVSESFILRGSVDASSGNIDFIGAVTILGDVLNGFSVRAGGDLIIRGMAEGAQLKSGGNLVLSNGMKGMGDGRIEAAGDVSAKYIENASVSCGGTVRADVLLNSIVSAGDSVSLHGPNALLVGGTCTAGRRVLARTIGSESGTRTEVCISSPLLTRLLVRGGANGEREALGQELEKERQAQEILRAQSDTVARIIADGNCSLQQMNALLKALMAKRAESMKKIDAMAARLEQMEQAEKESAANFSVTGTRIVYAGARIMIGECRLALESDYSNTKFYIRKGHIAAEPALPSDLREGAGRSPAKGKER